MIRIRNKQPLVSLFIGFLIGSVFVLLLTYYYKKNLISFFDAHFKNEKMHSVVVAKNDIPHGTVISNEDLIRMDIPKSEGVLVEEKDFVGKTAVINIVSNLQITPEMLIEDTPIGQSDEKMLYEIPFVTVGKSVNEGDFVDVRLFVPNGDDFIVLSKKEIRQIIREENAKEEKIVVLLSEKEIITLSSAYNDLRLLKGSKMYLAKYVDGTLQESALATYPVNKYVENLIKTNNLVTEKDTNEGRELIEACYEKQKQEQMGSIDSQDFISDTDLVEFEEDAVNLETENSSAAQQAIDLGF